MKRLYKINGNGRLWRIGNEENLSPGIRSSVKVKGITFWLEIMPDLAALGVQALGNKSAEQVWRESAAQAWVNTDTVVIDDSEFQADVQLYDWKDGKLLLNAERQAASEREREIYEAKAEKARLEQELVAEDYKIIKCAEAQAAGTELPYDIIALHAVREVKRDKINELEAWLSSNKEVMF